MALSTDELRTIAADVMGAFARERIDAW